MPLPLPPSRSLPKRGDLPRIDGAPEGAAWIWGEEDNLGRLNLLTTARIAEAATYIESGEVISLNLPLQYPRDPAFGRQAFNLEIKTLDEDICYDDLYSLNTQSGTHWDGFRHTTARDIVGPDANDKCSIHHWARAGGITGRGILLDYRAYSRRKGIDYDALTTFRITYQDLVLCAKDQGLDIRPAAEGGQIRVGDILFIRTGWIEDHMASQKDEPSPHVNTYNHRCGADNSTNHKAQQNAGVAQETEILDWLHDSYFAAVASDCPTFEAWPTNQDYFLHEYLLALWGMPIGEMLDLERLSARCRELNRWTFFFTSMPSNCIGGICSHVNGKVIL